MGEQLAVSQRLPWTLFHLDTNGLESFKSHINAIDRNKEKLHLTAEKLFHVCLRLGELCKHAGGNDCFLIKRRNRFHRRGRRLELNKRCLAESCGDIAFVDEKDND